MPVELRVPELGESIAEVEIAEWLKPEGAWVEQEEEVVVLETDKAAQALPAPRAGVLVQIVKQKGDLAAPGDVIAYLADRSEVGPEAPRPEEGQAEVKDETVGVEEEETAEEIEEPEAPSASPLPAAWQTDAAVFPAPAGWEVGAAKGETSAREKTPAFTEVTPPVMPAARRVLAEHGLRPEEVEGTSSGGRILKEDVQRHVERKEKRAAEAALAPSAERRAPSDAWRLAPGARPDTPPPPAAERADREEEVVPMSVLRRRIAERLVEAQQTAALLTTFNEIDMSAVIALRKAHQEAFQERHGVKLGFMSFFVKAVVEALKRIPQVNAEIRGTDIVYRNYYDIGIAIGGGRGLVVPVLRNAERMSFAEIERAIADFAQRARENRLKLEELQGGTFTITNGGVYGSLLSTPIVNPPQSGILGMHAIQDRPVAREGQVVIRPMMYVALTYDHRLVDGREAVTFLRHIKELVEEPARMLLEI